MSGLTGALAGKQTQDGDLDAIAALSPSNDDILQRKAGAWVNRTLAQLKADLVLGISDVNGLQAALDDAGGGIALRKNPRGPTGVDGDWWVWPDTIGPAAAGTPSMTATAHRLYAVPLSRAVKASGIGVILHASVSGQMRAGIYSSDPDTGMPKDLLVQIAAAQSTATSGIVHMPFAADYSLLEHGWLAIVCSAAAQFRIGTARLIGIGSQALDASAEQGGVYGAFTYASLPSAFPAITGRVNAAVCPMMALKQVPW